MAYYGPSGRTFSLTDQGATPRDITALIRTITGCEDLTATVEDVTGPADTRPVGRPTGFAACADVVMVVDQDTGGTWDARSDLVANIGSTVARTLVVTYSTGLAWTATLYIKNAKVMTPNMLETHVEATFQVSGTWTTDVTP
jgi:hypothetical protein